MSKEREIGQEMTRNNELNPGAIEKEKIEKRYEKKEVQKARNKGREQLRCYRSPVNSSFFFRQCLREKNSYIQ